MDYAIYLRKSRADLEAEARGEGETLARHRTALRALADRRGLHVVREYAEIVTGDSIAARPQMQALLDDVKQGLYAGVIVNDVDRLGRGDSIDQEIIKLTFVAGHCLIITPGRDINPAAPSDEDMLDFSMFFARYEYRKISQRLTVGRTRSAQAGNYLSPRVPFGYTKTHDGSRITLAPDPNTADIVRQMYSWYASGEVGYKGIATRLNNMGIRSGLGNAWSRAAVKKVLTNPVYVGNIVWGNITTVPVIEDGKRVKRHVKGDPICVEGAHEPIISRPLFDQVQEMFAQSRRASSTNTALHLRNPFAGILYCSCCGRAMETRGGRRTDERTITCLTPGCPTSGTYISVVMETLLAVLNDWCATYVPETVVPDPQPDIVARQRTILEGRLSKARELVEMGVYTPSEYLTQKASIEAQLKALDAPQTVSRADAVQSVVPQLETVLDALKYAESIEQQNALLKTVVARIEYTKTEPGRRGVSPGQLLTLDVYPRLQTACTL